MNQSILFHIDAYEGVYLHMTLHQHKNECYIIKKGNILCLLACCDDNTGYINAFSLRKYHASPRNNKKGKMERNIYRKKERKKSC